MRRLLIAIMMLFSSNSFADDLKLWYSKPAAQWEEALPIGNGHMGAMVFGGVVDERIQFNEDTLWTGKPHDYVREGAGDYLQQIRDLVYAGKEKEKELAQLVKEHFLSDPVRQKAYQPFGDLHLHFEGHDGATDYRRELDLSSAIAQVSYVVGDVTYRRQTFASYPDRVIVSHLQASKVGQLIFSLKLDSTHERFICAGV